MNKQKMTVGILIGNICASHSDDLLNGLVHKAEECEIQTLFFMGTHANCFDEVYYYKGGNIEQKYMFQFNTVFDYAKLGKLDVLLVVYSTFYLYMDESKEAFFHRFDDLNIPIIVVGDEYKDYTNVISDNSDGIRKCIEHLIQVHHCKKIAYMGGPKENNRDAQERYEAYCQVMKENGMEVKEEMVEFGDYSANSAPLFGKLLDHNPGVDGVVCANDTMALAGYEECRKRGLNPGSDVAITGFDDISEARSVVPSLTTIEQNAYDLGYVAMQKAIDIYETGNPEPAKVPVYFKHRESCGSAKKIEEIFEKIPKDCTKEEIAKKSSHAVLEKSFLYKLNIMEDKEFHGILYEVFLHLIDHYLYETDSAYDVEFIENSLYKLVKSDQLNINDFSTELSRQITNIIFLGTDEEKKGKISGLLLHMLDYIQNITVIDRNYRWDNLQRNIWTTPFITRDMIANIDNDEQLYECLMERLRFMKINNAYLFLLYEQKINHSIRDWRCPRTLRLAAKMENNEIAQNMDEIQLNREYGLADVIVWENCSNMAAYTLFAGKRIYGILVCEMTSDNITSMYSVSLHIGSAFQFIDLMKKQRTIQAELEMAMNALKSKNELLNMISEKDELTGVYNRRGFLENAMVLVEGARDNYLLCIYADLDHLKQINDRYGHKEGDFAIQQTGKYLQDSLRNTDVIGRIGGDEFAAVAVIHDESLGSSIRDRIKMQSRLFNAESDKPYYVEVSIGYAVFPWSEDLDLNQMLNEADGMLYDSKKERRKDVNREGV